MQTPADTVDDGTEQPAPLTPPVTGHARIDAALAELADLPSATSAQQLERLGLAHEALQHALADSAQDTLPQQPRDAAGRPVPGARR